MTRIAQVSPSRRVRRTAFTPGVEAAGVRSYTVYNHMLLPTVFENVEADYHHLKRAVQVWDVACERQVEFWGPDAELLLQKLTPRDLSKLDETRCFYIPITDENGGMLNDPVALKVGENHYWISIADSDLMLWIAGVATALNLNVSVGEPDVSPLAVQGPKADALMAELFGSAVTDLGFFRVDRFGWNGRDWLIARSGYSKQGGFEIYVEGEENGMPLWEALMQAGKGLDVRAGCPNLIERVEGGLLSYGNDMTRANTPFEAGLGRFVSKNRLEDCFGGRALAAEGLEGPRRQITPVEIEGDLPPCDRVWRLVAADGHYAGQVTSAAWSPDFETNVAIAMIERDDRGAGTMLEAQTHAGRFSVRVKDKFWI